VFNIYLEGITEWSAPFSLIQLVLSITPVLLFLYLYLSDRKPAIAIWFSGWLLNLIADLLEIYLVVDQNLMQAIMPSYIAKFVSVYLLLTGFRVFFNRPQTRHWEIGLFITISWLIWAIWMQFPYQVILIGLSLFSAAIYLSISVIILSVQVDRPYTSLIATGALTIWSSFNLLRIFASPDSWYWAWGYELGDIFQLLSAILMLLVYFQKTSSDLSASELLLRTLIEKTGSIVYSFRLSPTPKLEYVSPGVQSITGYSAQEYYEDNALIFKNIHPQDQRRLLVLHRSIVDCPGKALVEQLWRKDDAMVWIEHQDMPIFNKRGDLVGIRGNVRDITHKKQLETRDLLLKEVALMVLDDKPLGSLLTYICDKLVEIYDFNMTWIGMKEADGTVSPGGIAGAPTPKLDPQIRWDDTPEGQGACGKVIRSGKTVIQNMELEMFRPWYVKLSARKIRSVAAFPLKTKGKVLGVLIMYSKFEAFFSERIVAEIESFAEQIALALNDAITKQKLILVTTGLRAVAGAVLITGRHFKIGWNNPAFLKLTGYTKQEVRNKHLNNLLSGEVLNSAFYETIRVSLLNGLTWKSEIKCPKKDGNLIPAEISATPVKDEKGAVSHFVIVLRDITQRKQAEVAFQRYQLLCEQANDIILTARPDGQIIEANAAATRLYGYSKEELLAMRITPLFEPVKKAAESPEVYINNNTSQPNIVFETQHHRKDGTLFPVEVSAVDTITDNDPILFSIIRDINDRKQAEFHKLHFKETIARAEKLSSLGIMAACLSHEINQPLNSIKIITDSIKYWHGKGFSMELPEVMQAVNNISTQADRIDQIIKHVRTFVHSKNSFTLVPCDLNGIIDSVLDLMDNQLISCGIELQKNLVNDIPPIIGASTRIEEIIVNLVMNAKQALDTVNRTSKTLQISTSFENAVIMEISDNGPGIEESIINKIFEPFFTTNDDSDGMGLGLAIVHSIVTSTDGKISVVNNKNGGSTFRVEFIPWQNNTQEVSSL